MDEILDGPTYQFFVTFCHKNSREAPSTLSLSKFLRKETINLLFIEFSYFSHKYLGVFLQKVARSV